MIKIISLGSGSSGNAHYVEVDGMGLLLDAGLPFSKLLVRMAEKDKRLEDINAVFISHEHSDHIVAVPSIQNRSKRISVYREKGGSLKPDYPVFVGRPQVTPFRLSHDEPCLGFLIQDQVGNRLGYVSDTGCIPEESLPYLFDCAAYLWEFNYDSMMLEESEDYSDILKLRICSNTGHLCNQISSMILEGLAWSGLESITCTHLSKHNNRPNFAAYEARRAVSERAPRCRVSVSLQDKVSDMIVII